MSTHQPPQHDARIVHRWARRAGAATLGLAAAALLATAAAPTRDDAPTALAFAAAATAPTAAPAPALDVTERDVALSNAKVKAAYGALVAMWTSGFDEVGATFEAPRLLRYRGAVRTSCGVMQPGNAAYCPGLNTIYFDEVFVARQARAASQALGTDGDMAAVGVIAHEVGHAVATQFGVDSAIPFENEAMADCLAGSFARYSEQDGSLEEGDLEEAFFGLAAAGDPTPTLSGDRRVDARILRQAALMGHGTREQRLAHFTAGYERGARVCLRG